jgi:hypothetical protein
VVFLCPSLCTHLVVGISYQLQLRLDPNGPHPDVELLCGVRHHGGETLCSFTVLCRVGRTRQT